MKTYVLLISKRFPEDHPKAGEWTNFKNRILKEIKIHTIRANYPLWEKRIKEVLDGKAVISLREWIHEPYKSKQRIIKILDSTYGVGIQQLIRFPDGFWVNGETLVPEKKLAKNDGLFPDDFREWFKDYPDEPLAIIHFTEFRY